MRVLDLPRLFEKIMGLYNNEGIALLFTLTRWKTKWHHVKCIFEISVHTPCKCKHKFKKCPMDSVSVRTWAWKCHFTFCKIGHLHTHTTLVIILVLASSSFKRTSSPSFDTIFFQ